MPTWTGLTTNHKHRPVEVRSTRHRDYEWANVKCSTRSLQIYSTALPRLTFSMYHSYKFSVFLGNVAATLQKLTDMITTEISKVLNINPACSQLNNGYRILNNNIQSMTQKIMFRQFDYLKKKLFSIF